MRMDVMIKKVVWMGLTVSLLGFALVPEVRADEWDKKTVLTFSQPVEIPGHVLPPGTYTFKLLDSMSHRHIVQIFNADESQIIATVMAISDYRLTATEDTVIRFSEVPRGSPEAIRAWFYPGDTTGHEFVYPKVRAVQLARAAKTVVPALAVEAADVDALKSVQIVAITPDEREVPVELAIQLTPPPPEAAPTTVMQTAENTGSARELPQTASLLPFVILLGLGSIGVAFGLIVFGRRALAPTA
jgi:hypothetical protein